MCNLLAISSVFIIFEGLVHTSLPREHLDRLAQHDVHVDLGLCAGGERGLELDLPCRRILGKDCDFS